MTTLDIPENTPYPKIHPDTFHKILFDYASNYTQMNMYKIDNGFIIETSNHNQVLSIKIFVSIVFSYRIEIKLIDCNQKRNLIVQFFETVSGAKNILSEFFDNNMNLFNSTVIVLK